MDEAAARELKRRTLANLCNQRPTWLADLHRALDDGWPESLDDEALLVRLRALNRERARSVKSSAF